MIEIFPLNYPGEVHPGDDIAEILWVGMRASGVTLRERDVVVVTQKVISKSENRFADLGDVRPSQRAKELGVLTMKDPRLVELVLAESSAVIRAAPNILIARHRSGHVMANAGIDRSNIGSSDIDRVLLLPIDADKSARQIRQNLIERHHVSAGIVISDSFGRPWRMGVTNVAIGAAGIPSLIDRRGELDRDGRRLEITQSGFADMIAAAAGLATGEGAESVPAALVRGLIWPQAELAAAVLVRPLNEDLFQ